MSQIKSTKTTNSSNLRLNDSNDKTSLIKTETDDLQTKTILITNITQNNSNSKNIGENKTKRRSITILTSSHNDDSIEDIVDSDETASEIRGSVVLDRINICINNHFNDVSSIKTSTTTMTTATSNNEPKIICKEEFKDEPDSTTNTNISMVNTKNTIFKEKEIYNNGQDVLVQHKDGRLYLGTVIAISSNQCLVKFGDDTERWSSYDELSKLNTSDADDSPVCVICKKSNSETVEVCEKCGRGYHEKCTDGDSNRNGIWYCRRCTAENRIKNKITKSDCNSRNLCSSNINSESSKKVIFHKNELPYSIDALKWDSYHRVNEEQIYCYCGTNGRWYTQMLQCIRCEQWFHENCVRCIQYPLYCGDRFYLFVCSMCNYGNEFSRRLELNWETLVHLLLFNLTIFNRKKYYDFQTVILPYALDNWEILQLPSHIKNLTKGEIEEKLNETLKTHRTFKSGKEIKKSCGIWGLRTRIPPPRPHIKLHSNIPITEKFLEENLPSNIKILKESKPPRYVLENLHKFEYIMTGFAYVNDNSDNESTSSTESNIDLTYNSDDEISLKDMHDISKKLKFEKGFSSKGISLNTGNFCNDTDLSTDISDDIEHSNEIISNSIDCKSLIKKNLKNSDKISKQSKNKIIEIFDSSDDTSRGTLDHIIPPPKNFQGKNNPFRRQQSFENIDFKQSKLDKICNNNLNNVNNENNMTKKAKRKQSKNHIVNHSQLTFPIQNLSSMLGCEPFLNFDKSAGQHRIIRTIKRRLSDKDIIIGPNQEIKKRKYRRRSSANVEVISTQIVHAATKSAYLPPRFDLKDFTMTSTSHAMSSTSTSSSSTPIGTPNESLPTNISSNLSNIFNSGRRLRQRAEKNYAENSRRNSISNPTNNSNPLNFGLNCSPTKNTEATISELKSTVNVYFGAANRIANGERFAIKGTRQTSEGLTNYLVQWEGLP